MAKKEFKQVELKPDHIANTQHTTDKCVVIESNLKHDYFVFLSVIFG